MNGHEDGGEAMKHIVGIGLGVMAGTWIGPAVVTALGLPAPTGGFDLQDLATTAITVVLILIAMSLMSRF
jgi:hypothetical protein